MLKACPFSFIITSCAGRRRHTETKKQSSRRLHYSLHKPAANLKTPMAKSKETFNKKEKEKQRLKKRQDKEAKMEERKANASKANSLESMFAYIDENGNLSSTPPDPKKRKEIELDSIQLGAAPESAESAADVRRNGTISSFFHDKGFGFIKDAGNGDNVFVHINALSFTPQGGDSVSFETEQTPKGLSAKNVRKE